MEFSGPPTFLSATVLLQGLVASKIHGACLEEGEDSKGFIS